MNSRLLPDTRNMTQHGYRLAYDCSGSIAERLVESVRFVPEADVRFLTTTGARRTLRPIGLVMSALGHEQTSCHVRVMSVIPLKADIQAAGRGPLSAISGLQDHDR